MSQHLHYKVWRWQLGAAITLPWFGSTYILVKRAAYLEAPYEAILRHELCHAKQIERWGVWGYLWRHLWARVRTFSLLAKNHPYERECYEAEKKIETEETA